MIDLTKNHKSTIVPLRFLFELEVTNLGPGQGEKEFFFERTKPYATYMDYKSSQTEE